MSRPAHDTAVLEEIKHMIEEEQVLRNRAQLDEHSKSRLESLQHRLDRTWEFLRHRRAYLAFVDVSRPSPLFQEPYYH